MSCSVCCGLVAFTVLNLGVVAALLALVHKLEIETALPDPVLFVTTERLRPDGLAAADVAACAAEPSCYESGPGAVPVGGGGGGAAVTIAPTQLPFVITMPGRYTLAGPATLDANAAPSGGCAPVPAAPSCLFAAITIASANVALDLGGHTLAQSDAHALAHRDFALVAVADPAAPPAWLRNCQRPMAATATMMRKRAVDDVEQAGNMTMAMNATTMPDVTMPPTPGASPIVGGGGGRAAAITGVTISNGVLGRSSGYGVYIDDGARGVAVDGLAISDYEVAAVAGGARLQNVNVRNTRIGANRRPPVPATFGNARALAGFLCLADQLCNNYANEPQCSAGARGALTAAAAALNTAVGAHVGGNMDASVAAFGSVDEAPSVSSVSGVVFGDGGSGFVIHGVEVANVSSHFVETIGASMEAGKALTGPGGEVFQLHRAASGGSGGAFNPTMLVENAQSLLAATVSVFNSNAEHAVFGGAHDGAWAPIVSWTRGGMVAGAQYVRNSDAMFKVATGTTAVRIGSSGRVCACGVTVRTVRADGLLPSLAMQPGEVGGTVAGANRERLYTGPADGGHPQQRSGSGYTGADATGIAVHAQLLRMGGIDVDDVVSRFAWAHGVDVSCSGSAAAVGEVKVKNVAALQRPGERHFGDTARGGADPKVVGADDGMHEEHRDLVRLGDELLHVVSERTAPVDEPLDRCLEARHGAKVARAVGVRTHGAPAAPVFAAARLSNVHTPCIGLAHFYLEDM